MTNKDNLLAQLQSWDGLWRSSGQQAAEKVNLGRMEVCALACPTILHYVNPSDPEARSSEGMSKLKKHAAQVARQEVTDEITALQQEGDWGAC